MASRHHAVQPGTKVTVWPGYRHGGVRALKATVQSSFGGRLTVSTRVGSLVFPIADEGTGWARGWSTPEAKVLRATALLAGSAG